jgi:response regulator RpfG family c-di-GMP phosphodiesterase
VRPRVLLVDDQPSLLAVLGRALGDRFEVAEASSAERAHELLELSGPYAVVVSDLVLPGVSGLELLASCRERWPETTRVLLTAHAKFDVAAAALERADVFRTVAKPFSVEGLRDVVADAAARCEQMRTDRHLHEQLEATRDALLEFTESLEERVRVQTARLENLNGLAGGLNEARSIEEVGRVAVDRLSAALGGTGVHLELEGCRGARRLCFHGGAPLSTRAHGVPVRAGDATLGRLEVDAGAARTGDEQRLLATAAAATGVAVQREVRRIERDRARSTTAFALARLAEHRDDETGLHLDRVSAFCRLTAEGLREDGHGGGQLTEAFVEDLVLAAPLHDIGKVGVPDSVLLKPGKLSPDEWATMQQHATIGADTLRAILEQEQDPPPFLAMGLDIAWAHHERWNGEGYPRGLAGDEIPLAARIVAVADCYDALTTVRPYKDAWSHDDAMAYIEGKGGSQFDPHVVRAFCSRARSVDAIRAALADAPRRPSERARA